MPVCGFSKCFNERNSIGEYMEYCNNVYLLKCQLKFLDYVKKKLSMYCNFSFVYKEK